MKKTKSFPAGSSLDSLAHFAKVAADELTGDGGAAEIPSRVRITVEVLKGEDLIVGELLSELDLSAAVDHVERFIEYRRDELRRPINSLPALRRLLKGFAGNSVGLRSAIEESMRQGWRGLFPERHNARTDRTFKGGRSDGGEW